MLATFWFFIKTGIFITAFMWLINIGGTVHVGFQDYDLTATLGTFIIIALGLFWFASIIYRTIKAFARAPKSIATYNEKKSHAKGLQALAYGLSAVAAGDAKSAQYYAKRTARFLNNDFGLSALLSGLTARLNHDDKKAIQSFNTLVDHKETSFLGLKGLLQIAIEKGDYRYARVLAEKAHKQSPKQPWIAQSFYQIALHTKDYDRALDLLQNLKKTDKENIDQWIDDESILYLMNDDHKKASKLNALSLPIALNNLKTWGKDNKRRKSLNLIKRIWGEAPHPQILDFWIKYAPKKTIDNTHAMVSWIEDLHRFHPQSPSGALYIAEAVLRLNQTEHATRFLRDAIKHKPTVRAYQLMHRIDPLGGWLENIATAHQDMAWVCHKTGKIYPAWDATNTNGDFNTIEWTYPDDIHQDNEKSESALPSGLSLLDSQAA